jgi:Domain of unknown function (DUF5666)
MNRAIQTILAALAILLTSCGGGTLVAGIEGSGAPVAASGPVTGFGSIFVNGIEYSTAGAQIRIDDQPATESQLSVGDVVTVTGTVNSDGKTGTATQVSFSGNVLGTVGQVNVPTKTLEVLGQTVLVTGSTVFDRNIHPADITGITAGARVEVSGFANSFGQILASRIQLAAPANGLRVQGVVQALNSTALTFQVNALLVDYSAAPPDATLANGSIVDVQGSALSASGALVATSVHVVTPISGADNSEGEIDGVITAFTSNSDFMINGLHVTTNANTQFTLNGVTLGVNVRVAVEGSFDSSGSLVAASVEAKAEGDAVVRGLVQALPGGGTVTVLGLTITTSATTALEDDSSLMLRPFHLSDLQVGDYIEAQGTPGAGAALNADVLIRQMPDALSYLQGTAINVSAPTFTLLGVTVTTSAMTQYRAADGTPISAAQFFAQAPNATVEVGGTLIAGSLLATQAQIEGQ